MGLNALELHRPSEDSATEKFNDTKLEYAGLLVN
jgi:hypothetical protein